MEVAARKKASGEKLTVFPALTPGRLSAACCSFAKLLPGGVMAAQVTLTHLVMVRIHAGQPFDARCITPLAHDLRQWMRTIWFDDRSQAEGEGSIPRLRVEGTARSEANQSMPGMLEESSRRR